LRVLAAIDAMLNVWVGGCMKRVRRIRRWLRRPSGELWALEAH
jgi:hypothetical protein